MSSLTILAWFEERRSISGRAMIVAVHPDDETIGLGAQLCHFEDALIVHLTDGAPRNPSWATASGFATPPEYAAARVAELMENSIMKLWVLVLLEQNGFVFPPQR